MTGYYKKGGFSMATTAEDMQREITTSLAGITIDQSKQMNADAPPIYVKLSRKAKQLLKVIDGYNEDIQDLPDLHFCYSLKAGALLKLAQETKDRSYCEQALSSYNKANELDPDNPSYLVDRATLYVEMGNHVLAKQDLDAALTLPEEDGVIGMYIRNTIQDLQEILSPTALAESATTRIELTVSPSAPHMTLNFLSNGKKTMPENTSADLALGEQKKVGGIAYF